MVRAVRVQTTRVSAQTSKIPHIPCRAGSVTLEDAPAITEEPSPASLEKAPRMAPQRRAAQTP